MRMQADGFSRLNYVGFALADDAKPLISEENGLLDLRGRELADTRLGCGSQLFEALVVLRRDRFDHFQKIGDILPRLSD